MQEFHTQQELQKFLSPVLKMRKKALQQEGITMSQQEIFDYIKKEKWMHSSALHLYEIVEDILHFKIETKERK